MTSVLNVDTIAAKNGTSPVGLLKADTPKFWVNYDAENQVTRGSLNQSSLTDTSTGVFHSTLTNSMNAAENKCVFCTAANSDTTGGGSSVAGSGRGVDAAYGSSATSTGRAFATNEIQFSSSYGATAASNGANYDFVSTNATAIGDLA